MLCTCNTAFAGLLILCYELTAKNVQCVIDKESHDSFFFFFFKTILFTRRSLTLLTVLITLTLYLLLTLLILILTQIMHTLHYDTCITILLTLI